MFKNSRIHAPFAVRRVLKTSDREKTKRFQRVRERGMLPRKFFRVSD